MTVKSSDEYKVCALTIKDSNLICETGTNSPALRPEFKDLYIQEEKPATSQAATSQAATSQAATSQAATSQAAEISGEE
jgi:hypothetical protein